MTQDGRFCGDAHFRQIPNIFSKLIAFYVNSPHKLAYLSLCFCVSHYVLRFMPVLMHRSRLMSNNKNLLTYLLYGATVDLMNKTRCEMRHVKAVLFICGT